MYLIWQSLQSNILHSKFKKWHYCYGTKLRILLSREGPYIGRAGSKHKRVLEKGENNGYQKKEPIIKTQEILGLSTKFICAAYHNLSEMLQLSVRLCYKCVKIIKGTSHQSKLHLTSSLIRITAVLNEYSDCVVIHGVL